MPFNISNLEQNPSGWEHQKRAPDILFLGKVAWIFMTCQLVWWVPHCVVIVQNLPEQITPVAQDAVLDSEQFCLDNIF